MPEQLKKTEESNIDALKIQTLEKAEKQKRESDTKKLKILMCAVDFYQNLGLHNKVEETLKEISNIQNVSKGNLFVVTLFEADNYFIQQKYNNALEKYMEAKVLIPENHKKEYEQHVMNSIEKCEKELGNKP